MAALLSKRRAGITLRDLIRPIRAWQLAKLP